MRLQYLPANQAWVFVFGDQLVRMGDGPMFHETRADAVAAANACTLAVLKSGLVVAERNGVGCETTAADALTDEQVFGAFERERSRPAYVRPPDTRV